MANLLWSRLMTVVARAVYGDATAEIPASVQFSENTLVDQLSGVIYRMNTTAGCLARAVTSGRTIRSAVDQLCIGFARPSVESDCYRLIRNLNQAGLLNISRHHERLRASSILLEPFRLSRTVLGWIADALTCHRRLYHFPRQWVSLILRMLRCLLPWAALGSALTVTLGILGPLTTSDMFSVGIALIAVLSSLVLHELTHVVVLWEPSATLVTSAGAFRVSIRKSNPRRAAAAAFAGPLAGAGTCTAALIGSGGLSSPFAAMLIVLGLLCHIACLTPWAGDGRALIQSISHTGRSISEGRQ